MKHLRVLSIATILALIVHTNAFAQTSVPTPRSETETRKTPQPSATHTPAICKASFTSQRLDDSFYATTPKGKEKYGDKKGCETKEMALDSTESVPIFWVIAGDDWKKTSAKDPAKDKRDAAAKWFKKYCVNLDYRDLGLDDADTKTLITSLHKYDTDADNYTDVIWKWFYGSGQLFLADEGNKPGSLYKQVERKGIKADEKFLLVMFVDKFGGLRGGQRGGGEIDSVSLNFMDIPVIMISSGDLTSKQVLTHELTHALGKKLKGRVSEAWVTGRQYTWDHVDCKHNMDNAQRRRPTAVMTNKDSDPVDWAAYWEWLYGAHNLRLKP
jgi:hypothetical protein